MLPEPPAFYACNYMYIRVTHRNGAIKHIFYTNQIHGGIISRLFFIWILSLYALALHLAVKILLQIFLYEDLSTLALHTSVGCISSRMPAGPHFVTQPILLSENIPNIWHKSSTKNTRRSDQDWNDKNDNANPQVPRITCWKVLPNGQLPFLKKYSIKCEKI